MGLYARYGLAHSIVSNNHVEGTKKPGELTLKNEFGLKDDEVERLRKEISLVGMEVGRAFDSGGVHYGNLGIDLAIDYSKNIWILETNKTPNILMEDINRCTKLANMLYAKRLAGFYAQV